MKPENWIKWDLDSRLGTRMAVYFGEHGAVGYGFFVVMVELLYRANNNRLACKDSDMQIYAKLCKVMQDDAKYYLNSLCEIGLLKRDKDEFWSERVLEEIAGRATNLQSISAKRKAAAEARWGEKKEQKQTDRDTNAKPCKTMQGDANDARERGEEKRGDIISKDKSLDKYTPTTWKGCEFLRMTQEEARKVLAVYQTRKYPVELLPFAVEVLDGWLSGTSTEAIKARKQETHYRRLYAEWVLKKAQGLYKLADKPAGGEQKLTNTQKAENLLRKAKLEESYDQGRNGGDVAVYGSHVASNGSERVSTDGVDGSLWGGKTRGDEKSDFTPSK